MNPLWFAIPIVMGICHPIVLQMSVRVSKDTGDMESAVILHVIGAIIGLGWVGIGVRGAGFSGMGSVPWWAFLAGAIGVTCLAVTNRTLPVIGVAAFCAIAVASQLVMALIFDQYGLMDATMRKVTPSHWVGVGLLVSGAFLVSR